MTSETAAALSSTHHEVSRGGPHSGRMLQDGSQLGGARESRYGPGLGLRIWGTL